MVLVDTSVWISHLRTGSPALAFLLEDGEVAIHPFVVGELACGSLKNRDQILELLQSLPGSLEISHEEAIMFINRHQLMGKGLGYIDIHLLASATLTGIPLWTFDKKLKAIAIQLQIVHP